MGTRISIFIVGVILARLLTPEDFGLVAMLGVFFAVSSSLVDSGFTNALIREKQITEKDKSTVFFINLFIAVILYLVLWFTAPLIAGFFNQPQLIWLTRVMGLDLIFKAFSIVQRAVLMQSLRFKLLSKINIGVSLVTGAIAVFLAYKGLGVWALAIKFFLSSLIISIVFWVNNPWIPRKFINKKSFDYLFGFGSKIMLTGLLNTLYNNIYKLVIGRFFPAATLGFFDRASIFTNQIMSGFLIALQQVTYPTLSKTQDDHQRLKRAFKKIITSVTFVNFPLAAFVALSAEPLIVLLLGKQWSPAVPFMQLLCVGAFVSHLSSVNQNLFKVLRRSDLYLKIALINKIMITLAIVIGLQFGIWGLIIGKVVTKYIEVIVCMVYTEKHLGYSIKEQFKDILPIGISLIPSILIMFFIAQTIDPLFQRLLLLMVSGFGLYLLTAILSKSTAYGQIKEVILPYIQKKRNKF